jgi:hypothetical protein
VEREAQALLTVLRGRGIAVPDSERARMEPVELQAVA